jgi:hypothetical protein
VPKIVDPDQLAQGVEVIYDKDAKTIQLLIAGDLDDSSPGSGSGVTGQAIYSFSKDEWLTDATLNELRFPFDPIFEQKLILVFGWKWADAQTRDLLRDVGWREIDASETAGFQSLGGPFDNVADQAYYQQIAGFEATADASVANFDKTGQVNEGVQFIGPGGTPDTSGFFRILLREQAKLYDEGELVADQSLAAVDFRFYGIPLSNSPDNTDGTGAPQSDGFIDGNAPYTGMAIDYIKGALYDTWADSIGYSAGDVVLDSILQSGGSSNGTWWFTPGGGTSSGTGTADDVGVTDWESYVGELQVGTEWYAFNRIVNGNVGTAVQIYEYTMRQLRQTTDINDDGLGNPNQDANGSQFGRIANLLSEFTGTDLHSEPGVALSNFDTNATNNIKQHDITVDSGGLDSEGIPIVSTERAYPFVAAGTLVFSQNLDDEINADTLYKMFFDYSERFTDTDVAVTASAGDTMTLTSTNIDLSVWAAAEFMNISGFLTNPTNNGMYEVTGTPAANSIDLIKVDGIDPIDEAAGDTVSVDTNPFDSPDAIVVNDDGGSPITGEITALTIPFDFDYTNNAQGGRTPNADAAITVIALGKSGARWTQGSFTIVQATGQNFPVNAADELVYSNP